MEYELSLTNDSYNLETLKQNIRVNLISQYQIYSPPAIINVTLFVKESTKRISPDITCSILIRNVTDTNLGKLVYITDVATESSISFLEGYIK